MEVPQKIMQCFIINILLENEMMEILAAEHRKITKRLSANGAHIAYIPIPISIP